MINTDKAPTYAAAIAEMKSEGKCPRLLGYRQVRYLNTIIEADHGKLKQLIKPARGFKTMKSVAATIKGFEVMRALRKGQGAILNFSDDIAGEARMVERAFGLGPCVISESSLIGVVEVKLLLSAFPIMSFRGSRASLRGRRMAAA